MRFASLGSGSEGNALLVEAGRTRVLIDCGFNLAETVFRLARLGVDPERIDAVVVTHEHTDHIGGVARFAARYRIPVWLTFGTLYAYEERLGAVADLRGFDSHDVFAVGDVQVLPFPVPHDAREPVQIVCSDGARRIGVLTDVGTTTPHIEASLSGCDALVLECNHDSRMLADGDYPWPLKQRVAGRFGHLANEAAAELLSHLDCSRLAHIVAAHLSQNNNLPGLARTALASALGCSPDWVTVADQANGFAWREVG
jgi:phosphoribosyl 1,2-cyclic phosphodiesterase